MQTTLPTSESPSKQGGSKNGLNQTKRVTFEPLHDSSEEFCNEPHAYDEQ